MTQNLYCKSCGDYIDRDEIEDGMESDICPDCYHTDRFAEDTEDDPDDIFDDEFDDEDTFDDVYDDDDEIYDRDLD